MIPRSGRTSGPRPRTTSVAVRPRPAPGSPVRARRSRRDHEAATQSQTRPISSPAVAKSHTTGRAATHRTPTGTTTAASGWSRRPARAARTNPPTAAAIPSTTATHSRRSAQPMVSRPARRAAIQSGLVETSTRSPSLKTGPCPARIWSITRRLMKPSSSTQRWLHAPTSTISAGASSTRSGSHRRSAAHPDRAVSPGARLGAWRASAASAAVVATAGL